MLDNDKGNHFEINAYQVSCPLHLPLYNMSSCQSFWNNAYQVSCALYLPLYNMSSCQSFWNNAYQVSCPLYLPLYNTSSCQSFRNNAYQVSCPLYLPLYNRSSCQFFSNWRLSSSMSIVLASLLHVKLPCNVKIHVTTLKILYIYMTALLAIRRTVSLNETFILLCWSNVCRRWTYSSDTYIPVVIVL